jgi:putative membrane protein
VALALSAYCVGAWRRWRRSGRGGSRTGFEAACFAAGIAVLLLALASPLDALADTLLSAHMVQHGMLITAAPLLLLAGRPALALGWALPSSGRRTMLGSLGWRAFAKGGRALSSPLVAAS